MNDASHLRRRNSFNAADRQRLVNLLRIEDNHVALRNAVDPPTRQDEDRLDRDRLASGLAQPTRNSPGASFAAALATSATFVGAMERFSLRHTISGRCAVSTKILAAPVAQPHTQHLWHLRAFGFAQSFVERHGFRALAPAGAVVMRTPEAARHADAAAGLLDQGRASDRRVVVSFLRGHGCGTHFQTEASPVGSRNHRDNNIVRR
jgi:hypothetical protein